MKIGNYIGADLQFAESEAKHLNDILGLLRVGTEAIAKANYQLLNIQVTQYQPFGLSIIFIIAQSHLALHTYPEHNYMQVEVSTCGDNSIEEIFDYIVDELKPITAKMQQREINVWAKQ